MAADNKFVFDSSFDHRVLDKSSTEIVETVSVPAAAWLFIPSHLPRVTHHDLFAARNGQSQETFEQRTHKRLIDILQSTGDRG